MNQVVLLELFDLSVPPSRMALDAISDELEKYEIRIDEIKNYDSNIIMHFSYPSLGQLNEDVDARLVGTINIDRIRAKFEVSVKFSLNESIAESIYYAPLSTKVFTDVVDYLKAVGHNVGEFMLGLLPKRAYKTVFNEAIAYDAFSNYRQLSNAAKEYLLAMLEQYKDGSGVDTFNTTGVDINIINELINGGYIMSRGNTAVLDRTAIDSLRAIVFG